MQPPSERVWCEVSYDTLPGLAANFLQVLNVFRLMALRQERYQVAHVRGFTVVAVAGSCCAVLSGMARLRERMRLDSLAAAVSAQQKPSGSVTQRTPRLPLVPLSDEL